MGYAGITRGRYEGACARDVPRSGNVTVYREIRVYAETQVRTRRAEWDGREEKAVRGCTSPGRSCFLMHTR